MVSRLLGSAPLCVLAVACAMPQPPVDARVPAREAPPLPLAQPAGDEQLDYSVRLAGLPVGSARLATRCAADGMRLELAGATNAVVDWFCAVRGGAAARLRPDGRARSFELWVEEDGERSERRLSFDEVPTLQYWPAGHSSWMSELTLYRQPRDPLALLHELRSLAPDDAPRDYEVAMTLQSFCYRVRSLGRADVGVAAGSFPQALLWRIEVRPYTEHAGRLEAGPLIGFYEVALSADERRLPLRVTREFGFGQVALELARWRASEPAPPLAAR